MPSPDLELIVLSFNLCGGGSAVFTLPFSDDGLLCLKCMGMFEYCGEIL